MQCIMFRKDSSQFLEDNAHTMLIFPTNFVAVTAPHAPGASLEDCLMYSTAPQSPTFEANGCPSLTNTPPPPPPQPNLPHPVNGQPHSMTSEEILQLSGATSQALTRPVVINAANGHQFLSNHLSMGYNPNIFHQGNGLESSHAAVNGCVEAETGNTVSVRPNLGQMLPLPAGIHYTEPLWVPVSSANQTNPIMIPNSSQCFNQYPLGSFGSLPGFRHVSAATGSLLQLAHGPSPQLAPAVGSPGYYFQPTVTPLLQAGMRFVYGTQQQQDASVSPTQQLSSPVNSAGPASPSDHHLVGHNERHNGRMGGHGEHEI